ncbi:hypothetical protein [Mangrovivirga cuniculi]|uniref:Uncharacterized protein n=1 Tax=Mangrovivirga cuniculi TaxID=2715131 RepID=A0A4D7JSB2_9BACT|nr:hypothetical protein [Mangrovivirga cuniculi]QCK15572.1 hypothetical protein DCC35_12855 [Mangrovivirga cuniculi]
MRVPINILIFILLGIGLNLIAQDKEPNKLEMNNFQILENADIRIINIDTLFNDSTGLERIIGYDKNNKIVKITSLNKYSSLGLMGKRIEVYNIAEKKVLEQSFDYKGILWHQYIYEYDSLNRIIAKEGFSSGELGHRIEYIYKADTMVGENEYRNGQLVNSKTY